MRAAKKCQFANATQKKGLQKKKEKTKSANPAFCWALLSSPPAAAAACGAAAAAAAAELTVVASCLAATYKEEQLRAFKRQLGGRVWGLGLEFRV